jgi:predicted hydrocarbon binding protein
MSDKPRWVENSIMRLALGATEATLGTSGLNAVLHIALLDRYLDHLPPNDNKLAVPGTDFAALWSGIMRMYGEHAARGVFRRWGVNFGHGGVDTRPTAKLLKPMLNFLPLPQRTHTILEAFVREANNARGEPLHQLQEEADVFVITFDDCLYCYGLHVAEPICLTVAATIETVLKWGTGHDYAVSETTCRACGGEVCTFVIDKHPLHPTK